MYPVHEKDYKLDDAKDNCELYEETEGVRFQCNGNHTPGACSAPDNDSLGSCP